MTDLINAISLGAGKQSSYMLLTALEGKYGTKPDFAMFSDTGCEPDYVYSYVNYLKNLVKTKYDFDIHIITAGNLMQDVVDYVDGKKKRVSSLPYWVENGGLTRRQCTADYKIAPMRRFLQKIRGGKRVRLWIGISVDEMERMTASNVKYIDNYYPLVDHRVTVSGIIKWFKDNNMREPGKSACLICPFHSANYWRVFKKQYPDEFEKACVFDEKIRDYPNLDNRMFLFRERKPLRDCDFTQHPSLFPELIEECEGLCGL